MKKRPTKSKCDEKKRFLEKRALEKRKFDGERLFSGCRPLRRLSIPALKTMMTVSDSDWSKIFTCCYPSTQITLRTENEPPTGVKRDIGYCLKCSEFNGYGVGARGNWSCRADRSNKVMTRSEWGKTDIPEKCIYFVEHVMDTLQ